MEKAMPVDEVTSDMAVAVPDAPTPATLLPAAAAIRPEPELTVCPRLVTPTPSVQPAAADAK